MDVGVDRTVEADLCRAALCVVEEVQLIDVTNLIEIGIRYFHMRQQLAMLGVIRRFRIPTVLEYFLDAHTVVIVLEDERLPFAGHLLEPSANCPLVRPTTIIERIADCVIRNSGSVVRRQIVLPIIDNGRLSEKLRKRLCAMHIAAGSAFIAHL